MFRSISIATLSIFLLFGSIPVTAADQGSGNFRNRIAYLQNGDIYTADLNGSNIEKITGTGGQIAEFTFSPDLKYLAYTRVAGMVESPGYYEDDEEIPQTEIYSIVFVDLTTLDTIAQIEPEGEWLNPVRWTSAHKLLYYWSSGYDVSRFFEYDIASRTKVELDYMLGTRLMEAGISSGGRLVAYIDDIGLGKTFEQRLHLSNAETGEDRIIANARWLFDPCFSTDDEFIAFLTVETVDSQSIDNLMLYSLADGSPAKLASLPAKPKSGCRVQWSPGDSCIGIFYMPGYPPNGYVLARDNPVDIHEISGNEFCWLTDNRLLLSRGEGIFIYDMSTREISLLVENASRPAYLLGGN
ncbi:MAG: hypothetical protein AB1483_05505 [Candidatus Zixiibacteriota bacterium]